MKDPAVATPTPSRPSVVLYVAAIFASAFLIFLVEPMVGKRILPWFGGVPAVWSVCLAFYQVVLFLGYAYAHGVIRLVRPRFQVVIHAAMVALAIFSLPVLPTLPPDRAGAADPTSVVVRLLASNVGLPFLALAATGPIVQAWFTRAHPDRSPYPLYAVSNVGSLLALLAFPFVLEPNLTLTAIGRVWSWGFSVAGLLVLACALATPRATTPSASVEPADRESGGGASDALGDLVRVALSATAVVMLMSVTNKLCLDVASVPFLWVFLLSIYLATFILAFASERTYSRPAFVTLAVLAFAVTLTTDAGDLIAYQIAAYAVLLFSICMSLHGELYRLRPDPQKLTRYYLLVSAGGAIGGLFVGILAPRIFDTYAELPLGLALSVALVGAAWWRQSAGTPLHARLAARGWIGVPLLIATIAVAAWYSLRPAPHVLHRERSFFGVLTVHEFQNEDGVLRTLTSGTTVHGTQLLKPSNRRLPTSYFGRATGLGLMLTSRPSTGSTNIGIVGLGIGTIAAYGRAGDEIRFYEIDPVVAKLAGPEGYFTFLRDSAAKTKVVLGDGRLSIEQELQSDDPPRFDVLILDAFSSDAIPIHLMTREAFERYFAALAKDGLLAVHVSNRHFSLMSQVSRIASELGAHSIQIRTLPAMGLQSTLSDWVVVARDPDQLTRLQIRIEKRHRALGLSRSSLILRRPSAEELDRTPLWTDDYSDLLSVLK